MRSKPFLKHKIASCSSRFLQLKRKITNNNIVFQLCCNFVCFVSVGRKSLENYELNCKFQCNENGITRSQHIQWFFWAKGACIWEVNSTVLVRTYSSHMLLFPCSYTDPIAIALYQRQILISSEPIIFEILLQIWDPCLTLPLFSVNNTAAFGASEKLPHRCVSFFATFFSPCHSRNLFSSR